MTAIPPLPTAPAALLPTMFTGSIKFCSLCSCCVHLQRCSVADGFEPTCYLCSILFRLPHPLIYQVPTQPPPNQPASRPFSCLSAPWLHACLTAQPVDSLFGRCFSAQVVSVSSRVASRTQCVSREAITSGRIPLSLHVHALQLTWSVTMDMWQAQTAPAKRYHRFVHHWVCERVWQRTAGWGLGCHWHQ
jgi:hypothetical protein